MAEEGAATEALVLIHLSSLDSYTDIERETTGDDDNGYRLAFDILAEIEGAKGPVFIGDQQWLFIGRESRPRRQLWEGIEELTRKDITWVQFDEQDEGEVGWEKFLKKLDRWLDKHNITQVALGGLFWEDDLSEGCVTHVYKHLKKIGMPVVVLLQAVGSLGELQAIGEDYREEARERGEEVEEPEPGELPGGYTHGEKSESV